MDLRSPYVASEAYLDAAALATLPSMAARMPSFAEADQSEYSVGEAEALEVAAVAIDPVARPASPSAAFARLEN